MLPPFVLRRFCVICFLTRPLTSSFFIFYFFNQHGRRERECPMVLPEATDATEGGEPGDKVCRARFGPPHSPKVWTAPLFFSYLDTSSTLEKCRRSGVRGYVLLDVSSMLGEHFQHMVEGGSLMRGRPQTC